MIVDVTTTTSIAEAWYRLQLGPKVSHISCLDDQNFFIGSISTKCFFLYTLSLSILYINTETQFSLDIKTFDPVHI